MKRSGMAWLAAIALLMVGSGWAECAYAVTACLDDLTQLLLALDAASNSTDSDQIRMRAGTYAFTHVIAVVLHQPKSLLVSGGWNDDCSAQDGGATIFDGQNQTRVLEIRSSEDGGTGVENITFVNATSTTNQGGAAALGIYVAGEAYVSRNLFIANHYEFGAAAIGISGGIDTIVQNNLVVANTSTDFHGAIEMTCTGGSLCFATNNTVIGNIVNDIDGAAAGLRVRFPTSTAGAIVANNLLWNNQVADLSLVGTNGILIDNDVGLLTGNPPAAGSAGNFSAEPHFAGGILNFRLASDSPTINRGRDCVLEGIGCTAALGNEDLGGAPRIQGEAVDIGAYESDVVFFSGLERRD